MKLLVPFGTRPEIIKLAPVVHALRITHDVVTVASGQQRDAAMVEEVCAGLELEPSVTWTMPTAASDLLGTLVTAAWRQIEADAPDAVMVQGDTSTALAAGLAARRCGVPVIHLEAGLRSWNERSPEELHRRLLAVAASLHLAPTERAAQALRDEGIAPSRVHVVGNSILDGLRLLAVDRRPVRDRRGIVLTAHRPANVDDPERLRAVVALAGALVEVGDRVLFPVHPRTRSRLDGALLDALVDAGVDVVPPLPWRRMIEAVAGARLVVTDSGGLQEEASWFGVPTVVLRQSTPRPEGVEAGIAALTGLDVNRALAAAARLLSPSEQERVADVPCPYGDGHTAERVAALLADPGVWSAMTLREPDLRDGPPC